MNKDNTLSLLAITATLGRIAELSLAQQEGRITATDFADTVSRVIAEAEPHITPPVSPY